MAEQQKYNDQLRTGCDVMQCVALIVIAYFVVMYACRDGMKGQKGRYANEPMNDVTKSLSVGSKLSLQGTRRTDPGFQHHSQRSNFLGGKQSPNFLESPASVDAYKSEVAAQVIQQLQAQGVDVNTVGLQQEGFRSKRRMDGEKKTLSDSELMAKSM